MARRVNQATTEPEELAPTPLPGGTAGIIEEAIQTIPEPGKPSALVPPDMRPEVRQMAPPKRYQVERGGRVWLHGYGAEIKHGRIIDETMYDLEGLRKQGISLKPID
jgi:hypothetical protein